MAYSLLHHKIFTYISSYLQNAILPLRHAQGQCAVTFTFVDVHPDSEDIPEIVAYAHPHALQFSLTKASLCLRARLTKEPI